MTQYFSDRERGSKPRIEEIFSATAWGGVVSIVQSLITTGAFGNKYPDFCPDGQGPIGTDEKTLALAIQAEMPGLEWPLITNKFVEIGYVQERQPFAPDTLLILDFIEFCFRIVAKPIQVSHHSFFGHYHLSFDEIDGRQIFVDDINRVLSRNSLSYELKPTGYIERLAPTVLRESLASAHFRTGDATLDQMLEDGRIKFMNPNPGIRREAVERLWDCWERIKSLESPDNKKQSVESLLSKGANDTAFRSVLEIEARALTDIGNSFHIRHSEVTQSTVTDSEHIDYLFHRLYSLIQLLLSKRACTQYSNNICIL